MAPPDWLADPVHHGRLTPAEHGWTDASGRVWPCHGAIASLLSSPPPEPSVSQRAMQWGPLVHVYERWWRPWFTRLGTHIDYDQEDAFLAAHLPPRAAHAVDLACGTGRIARRLRSLGVDHVVGIDLSLPMLRQARSDDIIWVQASALALPIASQRLDALTSFGAFHLFPAPDQVLAEVARVLKPGGSFLLHTVTQADGGPLRTLQTPIQRRTGIRFVPRRQLLDQLAAHALVPSATQSDGAVTMVACKRS